MRPFLQGLSTLRKHVYLCKSTYYYRSDVPLDVAHYFPTTEVKRSLKTSDPGAAKLAELDMELKVQQACTLLRVGNLSEDIIQQVVEFVVPDARKPTAPELSAHAPDFRCVPNKPVINITVVVYCMVPPFCPQ